MLVSLAGVGAAGKDYYSLLGVSKTATDQQLKKAYRKAAMRWHPDKHPENKEKATTRFQEIAEAYETLSDPEKRRLYDLGGAEAAKGQPGPGPADSGDRRHAHPGHGVRFTSQGGDVDPEVLRRFAEMFSSQTGAGFQGPGARHFFSSGGGAGFGFGGGHPGFDGRAQPQAAKQGPPLFGAGTVQELSFDNHGPQIEKLRSKGAAVVLFYSSGGNSCPRLCHEIRGAFARFAEARKGELPVVALQCLRRKGECAKHADGFPAVVLIGRDQKQDAVLSKGVAASFSQLQAAFGKAWPKVSQAYLSPEKGTVSELKTVHIANKDQLCGGQYCLLLVERGPEERARGARAALQKAARRLRSQPVHAFYVRAEKHPGFVASFAKASSGLRGRLAAQVLLVRPKSDRYEVFDGDAGDPAALVDFVSTVLSRGTALPHRRLAV